MTLLSRTVALATLVASAAASADGTFEIGAGYSPDEGFIGRARIAQSNLFGSGTSLSLSADVSLLATRGDLNYTIPNLGDTGLDVGVDLIAARRTFPGFDRESVGGALTLGHQLDRATRMFVRYRIEDVALTPDPTAFAARTTTDRFAAHRLAWLGSGLAYNTLDSPIPLRGTRLELTAEASGPEIGSDYQLLRFGARADHAMDLGPLTLRLHGHATYIHTDDPAGVPLSERLFHDGYADVRGYPIYSIGSRFGENLEALGRAELELPVWRRAGLSIAGFYDVGLRYNEDASYGPIAGAVYRSVGGSLIWRSPIGPLRFDVAFPLDGKDRDRAFLLNIGAGF